MRLSKSGQIWGAVLFGQIWKWCETVLNSLRLRQLVCARAYARDI